MSSLPPLRRRLIGFSTKMYFSFEGTQAYTIDLINLLSQQPANIIALLRTLDIFLIPDHISLSTVISRIDFYSKSHPHPIPILTGAQDAFHEGVGPFTGAVSPTVLAEIGCRIVELGHAERRRYFGETNYLIAKKAQAAVRNNLIPLVCIGEETAPDSVYHGVALRARKEIREQVEAVLRVVPHTAEVIFAYEPVWAIGASAPASAEHIVDAADMIRCLDCVKQREGLTRILYGGSARQGLFESIKWSVDGLFLGRFAHDPRVFLDIVKEVAAA